MMDKNEENTDHLYSLHKPQPSFTTKMEEAIPPTTHARLMDTSFEQNLSEEHGKAIWNGSVQLLRGCLQIHFDCSKGFNDENILQSPHVEKDSPADPLTLISRNSLLSTLEKKQISTMLAQSSHLLQLLSFLYNTYIYQVFEELVVLIHEILTKYLSGKTAARPAQELQALRGRGFLEIGDGEDWDGVARGDEMVDQYGGTNQAEIFVRAQEVAMEVANCFFVSTKIRLLNLKDIDGVITDSNTVRSEFEFFMQILAKSVFLCAEGCFQHPNQPTFVGISEQATFTQKMSIQDQETKSNKKGRKRINQ